jgi:hypothetical protein
MEELMVKSEEERSEDKWPSVDLAYDIALLSYDWLQQRLDAVTKKTQFLLTIASSITLATPVFAKALLPNISFSSLWFETAIGFFVLTVVVGLIGWMWGGLELISPQKLYEGSLSKSVWEFKKDVVYWAGEHFENNASLVNRRANLAIAVSVFLVLEIVLLVAWIVTSK